MLVEVRVPQLSESVAEATLSSWHKKAGDFVNRDENLVDIETDKVVLETPAPDSGVLVKIVKGDGSTVVSKELIATLDTDAKPRAASPDAAAPAVAPQPAKVVKPAAAPVVMPAAQKIAAEYKIDPAAVSGSGRGGRVTKSDVLDAVHAGAGERAPKGAAAPTPAPARASAPAVDLGALGERPEQRVPMSRLRARIAERLVQSQATAAILTTFNEANMQPVIELRNRYKESFEKAHGVKLGFTARQCFDRRERYHLSWLL